VAASGLARFRLPVHPSPAADDTLDVVRGAGPADRKQALFGLESGDPVFIGESPLSLRRIYTPIFERPWRLQNTRSRSDL